MADKYVVGRVADIPVGGRLLVEVNGRPVGVFNIDGKFFGLINRCPHKGAEMCKGNVVASLTSQRPGDFVHDPSQKFIMCPWHGWEFDVRTGQSYIDPVRTRLRTYDVEVATGPDAVTLLEAGQGAVAQPDPDSYAASSVIDAGAAAAEVAAGGENETDETGRAKGPYVAETVEVTVEDEFLVVSMRPARPTRAPR